ncbi:hypothetical protein [Pleionea sediminis]|uniref:hypothetical protein n=1 Tax=Pleionea sediminis TaxID=2569479 RepID=UPI0011847E70|nr:hypothetical protein [Pleionea sediminis]
MFKKKFLITLMSLSILTACSGGSNSGSSNLNDNDNQDPEITPETAWESITGVWDMGALDRNPGKYFVMIEEGKMSFAVKSDAQSCFRIRETELQHEYETTFAWTTSYDYEDYLDTLDDFEYEGEIHLDASSFEENQLPVKEIMDIWKEESELNLRVHGLEVEGFYYEAKVFEMFSLPKTNVEIAPLCESNNWDE